MANPKKDDFMNLHSLGNSINGDNVTGFMSPTKVKNVSGHGDFTNVMTYMTDGKDDKEQMEKYLGFFELFKTTHDENVPMIANIVKDMAVMNVEDHERITYDIAIPENTKRGATSLVDTSKQTEGEIVSGQTFYIIVDRKFSPGNYLKFDVTSPYQVEVSQDHDITPSGEGYKTYITFESSNKKQIFPKSALQQGKEWILIAHPLAEYGTDWSEPHLGLDAPGKIRMEVKMPSPQGIQTSYTMRGGNMTTNRVGDLSKQTMEHLEGEMDKLGGFDNAGAFLLGKTASNGKGFAGKPKVSTTLEYLAVKELLVMQAFTNMFANASEKATSDGVKRIGEGAWFQARRGKIITYPRPGALQIKHLQEASSYIFGNKGGDLSKRYLTFKGGQEVVINGLELIKDHTNDAINGMPSVYTGTLGLLGKDLIEGTPDAMKLRMMRFTEAFIPSVGNVTFEHDPSFDFQPLQRKIDSGYTPNGYNNLSYSLMVDAAEVRGTDTSRNVTGGAKLMDGGNKKSNFYYLKPENHFWWGREYGRMNQGDKFTDLRSSLKYMGNEFFAAVQSYVLMVDTTAKVIIELQNTYDA
jgi:hypothetical protein